ncbi:MAG: hypothetical protein N2053_00465 [Chitinispirillaceae bacterium]|nr:hypothetical protein [Chitinispirillaceae bacterium]
MNILWLFFAAIFLMWLGYRYYSRYIAKILGEDKNKTTPAVEINDGKDYCPTKSAVVFAHHFASIAGAGPILGPTIAVMYGVIPVWLWVILGGIFIGAVHDYTTLFVSLRERGKSIAEIARKSLGESGFLLMIVFTIIMILLVTSAFLIASATSLTSLVSLDQMKLPLDQNILHTVNKDGVVMGKIGGIASTSVIIITLFSPLVGFLNYKKSAPLKLTVPLAIIICIISIIGGLRFPVSLDVKTWMILLAIYTLFASGLPVWIVLQPRDFINVYILYGGLFLLIFGTIGAGLRGTVTTTPLLNINAGNSAPSLGLIWPFLFITVACGAISGFHALVAGGTVSKQVTSEPAARTIGYGGMLLESLLALGVLIALSCGIKFEEYVSIVHTTTGKSNPILAFSIAMSGLLYKGLNIPMVYGTIFGILMVEGFVATSLDTAVRINRYLFEELWQILLKNPPKWLKSYIFNSALSVGLMLILAFTNAFSAIWAIFGTANQLLAALTLVTLAVWLATNKKENRYVVVPAFFMITTTLFALIFLAKRYIVRHNFILLTADIIMIALACVLVYLALTKVKASNNYKKGV